jgi:predicted aconitase
MRSLVMALGCLLFLSATPAFADEAQPRATANRRIPAYVATGVTAAFLITSTVSYIKFQQAVDGHKDKIAISQEQRDEWNRAEREKQAWRDRAFITIGGTIVSGAITGYLWSRAQAPHRHSSFTVTSDGKGGTAWLGGSF